MASMAQRPAPSVPAAKAVSSKASEEFATLKHQLGIDSWEMSPNGWDKIQITYTTQATEQQARSFAKAIELPDKEIL